MWSKSTTLESSGERRMRWREFGGHSKRFMGKGEEEIAARTLRVSNYFYYPKSPFLVQSGLLGSCKKLFPSHSSPRDISKSLLCCGAKACHIAFSYEVISSLIFSTPALTAGLVPATAFLLMLSNQDFPGSAGQHMSALLLWCP